MFDSFVAVSDRDKQRALELVLQSRTFVRSEQLRAFLRYVCSMEIEGRGEQITEYRIAVEALGRSQDYTTTEVAPTWSGRRRPGVGIFGGRLVTRVRKTHSRQLYCRGMGSPIQ